MKLNCHIYAKYLPFPWLHTSACLSSDVMIQKQSFLFCDMVSTTYHYSLAAEPEKNCLTVTTLEVYLA